ncbi:MAG TPA: AzlC family ABC transporter permease [Candidatus Saccharimonadales bacterium]|nr:AzlC family ABC transporter permease [Candidatus Saccharimonadales bacterium]
MSARRAALAEGWPVLLSAFVVGVPFGIVARQAGLAPIEIVGMSVFVFAGASQFVMVQLLSDGAAVPLIVATVFLVNFRHALMSATLRPFLGTLPVLRRLAAAYFLTDEAFAMTIGWIRRGRREVSYYVTFGIALFVVWNLATVIGLTIGPVIGEPRRFGIDFAITATFIAIVALGLRHRADAVVALVALVLSAGVALAGVSVVAVVAAGLVAPLAVLVLGEEQ